MAATLGEGGPSLSRAAALERVLAHARPLAEETVAVTAAAGRVLAKPVPSSVDLPPFAASAMDGYAVRAADLPGDLAVVGRIAAGSPAAASLAPGQAMAIATGGVVPEGADTVVPIEEAELRQSSVRISHRPRHGEHVRPAGGDLRRGELVVAGGVRLGPAQLAALAASGAVEVVCGRLPSVRLLLTGSELRRPGESLRAGEIYDANGVLLAAQVRSAGGVVAGEEVVGDDRQATLRALTDGLDADVLVTSGGVSVGSLDFVREVASELAVEEVFWRVAIRPGRPISFGVHGRTLVFGLPGNPVSSLVGFELFVRPALLALQGLRDPSPRYLPGALAAPLHMLADRESLVRARRRVAAGAVVLDPLRGQESHMIAHAAAADALVLVPCGDGELGTGSPVEYLELG